MCGITSWSLNEPRKEVAGSFLQCEYLLAFVFSFSCSPHNECDPPSWKTIHLQKRMMEQDPLVPVNFSHRGTRGSCRGTDTIFSYPPLYSGDLWNTLKRPLDPPSFECRYIIPVKNLFDQNDIVIHSKIMYLNVRVGLRIFWSSYNVERITNIIQLFLQIHQ